MAKRTIKAVPPAPVAETQPVLSAVTPPALVTVIFKRAHRHAGVQYYARDKLEVTPETADLLRLYDAIGGA